MYKRLELLLQYGSLSFKDGKYFFHPYDAEKFFVSLEANDLTTVITHTLASIKHWVILETFKKS